MTDTEKKRAEEIRADLEKAIAEVDVDKFLAAYGKTLSHYYMPARDRKEYYRRMLEATRDEKNHSK